MIFNTSCVYFGLITSVILSIFDGVIPSLKKSISHDLPLHFFLLVRSPRKNKAQQHYTLIPYNYASLTYSWVSKHQAQWQVSMKSGLFHTILVCLLVYDKSLICNKKQAILV